MKSLIAFAALALGCSCDWRLERMLSQPRVGSYADDPARLELMKASSPPAASVPWRSLVGPPELTEGCAGPGYAQQIPIDVTDDVLKVGHDRFALFCATCHGSLGTGDSLVAGAMEKAKPSSLIIPPVRDYPAGRVFRTVGLGYKFMPTYRDELNVRERWATVAYLRRLQTQTLLPGAGRPAQVRPGPVCQGESP